MLPPPLPPAQRPDQGTTPPRQGLASNERDGQSAQQRKEERDFILTPNEEQREWVDTDDEEPLLARMHTWDSLKGISSQTAACAKGRAVWPSSPGCQAVSPDCQSGRAAAVIGGGQLSGHLICS